MNDRLREALGRYLNGLVSEQLIDAMAKGLPEYLASQREAGVLPNIIEAVVATHVEWHCSCGGRRWVNDENWSAEDSGHRRTQGDGLIPCGSCNHGGWDTPEHEPHGPYCAADEQPWPCDALQLARLAAIPADTAWEEAVKDPALVARLDEGLADVAAGRTKPWSEVHASAEGEFWATPNIAYVRRRRGEGVSFAGNADDTIDMLLDFIYRSSTPNVPGCRCDRDDDSWVGEGVPMPMCPMHDKRLRHLSWESLACMVIDYEAWMERAETLARALDSAIENSRPLDAAPGAALDRIHEPHDALRDFLATPTETPEESSR